MEVQVKINTHIHIYVTSQPVSQQSYKQKVYITSKAYSNKHQLYQLNTKHQTQGDSPGATGFVCIVKVLSNGIVTFINKILFYLFPKLKEFQ